MIENVRIDRENLNEEELTILDKLIAKSKGYPSLNEPYWYISDNCVATPSTWTNTEEDRNCYEICNYFKTKEEAINALDKITILTKIKRLSSEYINPNKGLDGYLYIDVRDMDIHLAIDKERIFIPGIKVSSGPLFNEFKQKITKEDIAVLLKVLV